MSEAVDQIGFKVFYLPQANAQVWRGICRKSEQCAVSVILSFYKEATQLLWLEL